MRNNGDELKLREEKVVNRELYRSKYVLLSSAPYHKLDDVGFFHFLKQIIFQYYDIYIFGLIHSEGIYMAGQSISSILLKYAGGDVGYQFNLVLYKFTSVHCLKSTVKNITYVESNSIIIIGREYYLYGVKIYPFYTNHSDVTEALVRSMDLNCDQVGLNFNSAKLFKSSSYDRYLQKKQIEIINITQVDESCRYLIAVKKLRSDCYLNTRMELNILLIVAYFKGVNCNLLRYQTSKENGSLVLREEINQMINIIPKDIEINFQEMSPFKLVLFLRLYYNHRKCILLRYLLLHHFPKLMDTIIRVCHYDHTLIGDYLHSDIKMVNLSYLNNYCEENILDVYLDKNLLDLSDLIGDFSILKRMFKFKSNIVLSLIKFYMVKFPGERLKKEKLKEILPGYFKRNHRLTRPLNLKGLILPNQWAVRELLTEVELEFEGERMKHCVGTYAGMVRSGKSRIFSLSISGEYSTLEIFIKINPSSKARDCYFVQLKGVKDCTPGKIHFILARKLINHIRSLLTGGDGIHRLA